MTKFYEMPFDGEESSFYVVFGNTVGLFFLGQLSRTLVTLAECQELARTGRMVAYA